LNILFASSNRSSLVYCLLKKECGEDIVSDDDDEEEDDDDDWSSITICKIILDENGDTTNGSKIPSTTFRIRGVDAPEGYSSNMKLPTSQFRTPLVLNKDILYDDGINDAQCVTYLVSVDDYFYGQETIEGSDGRATPLYTDQYSSNATTIEDFHKYDATLFTDNDGSRNRDADGHIILTDNKWHRTLLILNQYVPEPECGNNEKENGEECDDGNLENGDGCSVMCQEEAECHECDGKITALTMKYNGEESANIRVIEKKTEAVVFDGIIDSNELFSFVGTDKKGTLGTEITIFVNGEEHVKIHTSCSVPIGPGTVAGDFIVISGESRNGGTLCPVGPVNYCGDGAVNEDEECDDGNMNNNDGCSNTCTIEIIDACGDWDLDLGEECDDGNTEGGDGCNADCKVEYVNTCGDGALDEREECDDQNRSDGDACSSTCTLEIPTVGLTIYPPVGFTGLDNEFTATTEEWAVYTLLDYADGTTYNDPVFPAIHRYQVLWTYDVILTVMNNYDGEIATWTTRPQAQAIEPLVVQLPVCGDGYLIPSAGEECDDGNLTNRDGCSNTCVLETPTWELSVYPPVGFTGLDNIFSASTEAWATYTHIDYGDLTAEQSPTFPTPHRYHALGTYDVVLTIENNYTGDIALRAVRPRTQVTTIEKIIVVPPVCGDGYAVLEAGEECDFWDLINGDGCDSECKWEPPTCTIVSDYSFAIFDELITFTISDFNPDRMVFDLLDFDDGMILLPEQGLEVATTQYLHGYDINNLTFGNYDVTLTVSNGLTGSNLTTTCFVPVASHGQDYSENPEDTVVVNTGTEVTSTALGGISVASMLYDAYIFNDTQLFELDGSQAVTQIEDPTNIPLEEGATDFSEGFSIDENTVKAEQIIKIEASEEWWTLELEVVDASGTAIIQDDTYVISDADRGGEIEPAQQHENVLEFGGTEGTTLIFNKPVMIFMEYYIWRTDNRPKYREDESDPWHDITTICNTPIGVEPTNIFLGQEPNECFQTGVWEGVPGTTIRSFHSTTFMVPSDEVSSDIFKKFGNRCKNIFACFKRRFQNTKQK